MVSIHPQVERLARRLLRGPAHSRGRVAEARDIAWSARRTMQPALHGKASPEVLRLLADPALRHLVLGQTAGADTLVIPGRVNYHLDLTVDEPTPDDPIFRLYHKAIGSQWIPKDTLPLETDVDPMRTDRLIFPPHLLPIAKHPVFHRMNDTERLELGYLFLSWSLSQFYYGEQGARAISYRLGAEVPWESARQMAATQALDEARHIEVFRFYLNQKLNKHFAVDPNLAVLLEAICQTPDWDISFLGMQIMVEGLALGSFRTIQTATEEPLLKSLLKYVIKDEARHVTFGIHALKEYYAELTESERRFRRDVAAEFAWLIYQRFMGETLRAEFFPEISRKDWITFVEQSELMKKYREEVFSRIVADLIQIGLIDPTQRRDAEKRFESMGLLNMKFESTDQLFESGQFSA